MVEENVVVAEKIERSKASGNFLFCHSVAPSYSDNKSVRIFDSCITITSANPRLIPEISFFVIKQIASCPKVVLFKGVYLEISHK